MEHKSKYIKSYAEICNILDDFINGCGCRRRLIATDLTYFSGLSLSNIFNWKPFIRRDNPVEFENIVRKYAFYLNRHYSRRNPNVFKRSGKNSEVPGKTRIKDI